MFMSYFYELVTMLFTMVFTMDDGFKLLTGWWF